MRDEKQRAKTGKKIAVIGFGKEGQSILKFLRTLEFARAEIWVLDRNEKTVLPRGVRGQLGGDYLKGLERFDLIIRSPGIRYHAPEIQAAIWKGITVTSPTKIFFDRSPAPIIGVTGTKGKGTTSTLVFKILEEGRKKKGERSGKVFLAGNIGTPALDILPKLDKRSLVVLEMSSFQLIDLAKSPHIAVALMITSEHLDWHKSVKEYRGAKANIVRFQSARDYAVVARDYAASRAFAKLTKAKIFTFARRAKPKSGTIARSGDGTGLGTFVEDGWFCFSDGKRKEAVCETNRLQIPGEHNWENVGAAITVAKIMGVPNAAIAKSVYAFRGLEHRLEFVAEKHGVRYYNDSYATTPETTIAAIKAFRQPKILILGGSSKGSDFAELGRIISKSDSLRGIIGIGAEWPRIKSKIKTRNSRIHIVENCKNMKDIVRAAKRMAVPGDVVLLSPACASFGMFKNYSDRGKQFKERVNRV